MKKQHLPKSVLLFFIMITWACSPLFPDGIIQANVYSDSLGEGKGRANDLAEQVTIRRTEYGIPHILAENLRAAGFALGYVQMEDYGERVADGLLRARGEWARYNELDTDDLESALDADAANRRRYTRAVETWHLLETDSRGLLEGFAAGVNRYIERNPDEFDDRVFPFFTGYDVHARGIGTPGGASIRRFLDALERQNAEQILLGDEQAMNVNNFRAGDSGVVQSLLLSQRDPSTSEKGSGLRSFYGADQGDGHPSPQEEISPGLYARLAANAEESHPEAGSNAWALAPDRTTSGNAVLVRNPHLSWDAGYYEAHVTVPGVFNFYGDFRIGGPLGIIGGFNEHLGFATTNNNPPLQEFYAFRADPDRPDHYLLDGASLPLRHETVSVEFKHGDGLGRETREFWSTPFGPVIHRSGGTIYVIRAAGDGEYRSDEQFLKMMKAQNLEEWKEAMRMQARISSNLLYADADGNIFYVWNAATPNLPHPPGGDTLAIPVTKTDQIWRDPIGWDELPQLLNPEGGYLHNENDPFHFTNLNEIFDEVDFPPHFPEAQMRLRSQHSHELIHNDRKFSLEELVELKHSMRMLLADRVKDDLITAVREKALTPTPLPGGEGRRGEDSTGEIAEAIEHLEQWDNTVARDSRGGVLFKTWWERYVDTADTIGVDASPESAGFSAAPKRLFREPWSHDRPVETPYGLADPDRAAEAFAWAVEEAKERYSHWDLAWGDVHRARIGDRDLPVGGCSGLLGCFRVLWFTEHEFDEQKLEVRGGDGWVFAVEFADVPRAYSILAYGQSNKEDSPYFDDQLEMFTNNQMKRVAFTEEEIREQLIREYRPGEE